MHGRPERDPERPVYVISVAATLVSAHPRTLRIYEDEGLLCPARTPTNIRLYSENDIRRITWIRHLTRERGVNLAGIRILFELEERLGARILEALYAEGTGDAESTAQSARPDPADARRDSRRLVHSTRAIASFGRRTHRTDDPPSQRRPNAGIQHRRRTLMAKRPSTPVDAQPETLDQDADRSPDRASCRSSPCGRPSSSRR